MKKLILAVLIVLVSVGTAMANPFLICDPQAGVTYYRMTGPAWMPTQYTAEVDGSIHMDVSPAIVGTTNMTIAACKDDAVWGEQCSSYVPFAFDRPSAASIPLNIRLQK